MPSMAEPRCWSGRRDKAAKGGTLFIERNSAALFTINSTIRAEFRNSWYLLNLGGYPESIPTSASLGELLPLLWLQQGGAARSGPLPSLSRGVDAGHALGPSGSSKHAEVRADKLICTTDNNRICDS